MFSKLQWKVPTWKGLVGIVAMLVGVIGALTINPGTLPRSIEQWLIVAGGVLLAVERGMDAIDNLTTTKYPNLNQTVPPQSVPSIPTTGGQTAL